MQAPAQPHPNVTLFSKTLTPSPSLCTSAPPVIQYSRDKFHCPNIWDKETVNDIKRKQTDKIQIVKHFTCNWPGFYNKLMVWKKTYKEGEKCSRFRNLRIIKIKCELWLLFGSCPVWITTKRYFWNSWDTLMMGWVLDDTKESALTPLGKAEALWSCKNMFIILKYSQFLLFWRWCYIKSPKHWIIRVKFLCASGLIFINWSIYNLVLCVFLFKDTLLNIYY